VDPKERSTYARGGKYIPVVRLKSSIVPGAEGFMVQYDLKLACGHSRISTPKDDKAPREVECSKGCRWKRVKMEID
jgi:hypothetical protein